ncbi:hypothetical protein EGN72_01675 [Pseudorhodobacter sp. E13]|nr:hypothetical protein EGN72_01675 [Pseudorhodobacter sp. E13]
MLFEPTLKDTRLSRSGASGHVEAEQSQSTADRFAKINDRAHKRCARPEQGPPAQIAPWFYAHFHEQSRSQQMC